MCCNICLYLLHFVSLVTFLSCPSSTEFGVVYMVLSPTNVASDWIVREVGLTEQDWFKVSQ